MFLLIFLFMVIYVLKLLDQDEKEKVWEIGTFSYVIDLVRRCYFLVLIIA